MTDSEKITVRQLKELVLEKHGSVERFCRIYHYRHDSIARFLNGVSKFDSGLYDAIREQCIYIDADVNAEVELLNRVIKKYFGSYENFCRACRIRVASLERILQNPDDAEFRVIAFVAYSKALHEIEQIDEYVNTMTPAKYLHVEHRRKRALASLQKRKPSV